MGSLTIACVPVSVSVCRPTILPWTSQSACNRRLCQSWRLCHRLSLTQPLSGARAAVSSAPVTCLPQLLQGRGWRLARLALRSLHRHHPRSMTMLLPCRRHPHACPCISLQPSHNQMVPSRCRRSLHVQVQGRLPSMMSRFPTLPQAVALIPPSQGPLRCTYRSSWLPVARSPACSHPLLPPSQVEST